MKKGLPFLVLVLGIAALFVLNFYSRYQNSTLKEKLTLISVRSRVEMSVLFGGDVMLGRGVESLMNEHGELYPFAHLAPLFHSAGAVIVNLEGTISEKHVPTPSFAMKFSFPGSVPSLLHRVGITHVGLANNHSFDYGEDGFSHTKKVLAAAGVVSFGHPISLKSAETSAELTAPPLTLLGFNATYPSFSLTGAKAALSVANLERPRIVFIHWGEEYTGHSSLSQETIAHALIDAGADMIIGHHPHVVQEIERYKGKLIFYSLGNLIFDQYFRRDVQEGYLIQLLLKNGTYSVELLPYRSRRSMPAFLDGEEKATFLDSLSKKSDAALIEMIRRGSIALDQ
jgi:poly-gamma-glutamate synthesis protein (capsule biosynthesis protein)